MVLSPGEVSTGSTSGTVPFGPMWDTSGWSASRSSSARSPSTRIALVIQYEVYDAPCASSSAVRSAWLASAVLVSVS